MKNKINLYSYKNENFEPILIVGHFRSGTTMCATILGSHSQIAIFPAESSIFTPAFRHLRNAAVRDGSHDALLKFLDSIPKIKETRDESVDAMFSKGPATPANLFRCLLESHAASQGKSRCGEKSPLHLLAVPELLGLYPRAKIVCMIRDGRDVVRSCRNMPFFDWEPDWWHALSWCHTAAVAERYSRWYPDRFLICRFESLVENPIEEVRRIDEFVGVPFEPSQVEGSVGHWVDANQWWHSRLADAPDRRRAYAWRQSCDSREARYLTGLMNPLLNLFGYDTFTSPSISGPSWLYHGYRALAFLLRIFRVSSRLTGYGVRTWRWLETRLTGIRKTL
jgi:hypothetical protein